MPKPLDYADNHDDLVNDNERTDQQTKHEAETEWHIGRCKVLRDVYNFRQAVSTPAKEHLFFIDGHAGTNKTILHKSIYFITRVKETGALRFVFKRCRFSTFYKQNLQLEILAKVQNV